MTTSRSLGHRAPLLWLVLPFVLGLTTGRLGGIGPLWLELALAALASAGAMAAAWRYPRAWIPCVVAAMWFAGAASYALHRARLPAWEALPPREARVELRVERTFAQADPRKATGLATLVSAEAHLDELRGQRLYFSLALRRGESAPLRSAVISVVGVLIALPRDPPMHSFDGYLAGAGMNFRLTRGRLIATVQPASAYHRFCQHALERFSAILSAGVAEKQPLLTSVLRAMLLGQKHELSEEHDTLFMRSGTMHLFAISGLHIGVIALGLHALLSVLRLPRLVRFAAGMTALWLYVDITGGTPSAVRAFIMVALVEVSLLLRLPGNPLSALAGSAGIVVLLWPMQVFSASFQMSYGIVAALLLLGLPLAEAWQARWKLFPDRPRPAWRWYHHWLDARHREALTAGAMGIASTLVSTLSGILFFKLVTPAAILANLVLIPVSSFVILAGLASLLVGLAGALSLAAFFNHAAVVVLWLIDLGVRGTVWLPGAWHEARFVSLAWAGAAFAALLATLVAGYRWDWRADRGGWWPPMAVVIVTLIFGVSYG